MRRQVLKLFWVAAGAGVLLLLGCGALGSADDGQGDTTNMEAVVRALDRTGYRITYRQVPRMEGYEMAAGTARDKRGNEVDFSVVLNTTGRIIHNPESRRGGSPQFPVVRYSENPGSEVGNLNMVTQQQSSFVLGFGGRGEGLVWGPRRAETRMAGRIEWVLYHLFAPGVRGGP